jgi:hypothetical protein
MMFPPGKLSRQWWTPCGPEDERSLLSIVEAQMKRLIIVTAYKQSTQRTQALELALYFATTDPGSHFISALIFKSVEISNWRVEGRVLSNSLTCIQRLLS